MTGAFIAVAVQRPALAIPLAFLSHFILDLFPHFGYGYVPNEERDAHKYFLATQITDAFVALGLYLVVPFLLRAVQAPSITALCMIAAQLPDALWIFEYTHAQRHGKYRERNWYLRFHKAIQWCERQWGAYVEVLYFGIVVWLIWLTAR